MLRILLVDDHDVVRQGLRKILEARQGWVVCGEASDGREAVEMALKLRPDVAVIDLMMPGFNGLEATRQIRSELPNTEVLVFTMHESEELIHEALTAGARGYVLKTGAGRQLVEAIETLSRHQPFFAPSVSATLLNTYLEQGSEREGVAAFKTLTRREITVVQMLAEGKANKDIAAALGISVKTVETHRAAVMRKLGLHSVADLVRYAIRNHLIQP